MTKDLTRDILPQGDLFICRDCLVHLAFQNCRCAIENIKQSGAKWLIATTFSSLESNIDIEDGDWRALNMQASPFYFPSSEQIRLPYNGKTYKDFDFRLKFKGEAEGNSGVFLRARITGMNLETGPDIQGMQVEVDPSIGKHTGGLYERGGREWVAMPSAESEKALKPGQWNDLEAMVHGNRITTYLNGAKISDQDPKPTFTEGVIRSQIHTGGGVKER